MVLEPSARTSIRVDRTPFSIRKDRTDRARDRDMRRALLDHLRMLNHEGEERGVLTTDGVHLNAAGNVFVATQAARALREAALARE